MTCLEPFAILVSAILIKRGTWSFQLPFPIGPKPFSLLDLSTRRLILSLKAESGQLYALQSEGDPGKQYRRKTIILESDKPRVPTP